jgi:hypothetical protein
MAMTLFRVRFTVRRMMVWVAVASVALGTTIEAQQRHHRRIAKARIYEQKVRPLILARLRLKPTDACELVPGQEAPGGRKQRGFLCALNR